MQKKTFLWRKRGEGGKLQKILRRGGQQRGGGEKCGNPCRIAHKDAIHGPIGGWEKSLLAEKGKK